MALRLRHAVNARGGYLHRYLRFSNRTHACALRAGQASFYQRKTIFRKISMATAFQFSASQLAEIQRLRTVLAQPGNASLDSGAVSLYSYIFTCVTGIDLTNSSFLTPIEKETWGLASCLFIQLCMHGVRSCLLPLNSVIPHKVSSNKTHICYTFNST